MGKSGLRTAPLVNVPVPFDNRSPCYSILRKMLSDVAQLDTILTIASAAARADLLGENKWAFLSQLGGPDSARGKRKGGKLRKLFSLMTENESLSRSTTRTSWVRWFQRLNPTIIMHPL